MDPISNVAIRDYFGTVYHLGCHHNRKSSTWTRTPILLLAAYLHRTKPNTNIPNASPPFPPSNCTTSPTPPNTKLIPVSDCLPHLTFGGPEPPKSQNQSITRLPMAITRQACEIPMRCDTAHPTPHPSRLNAGPLGMKKHILPI
jgi:hypothetical protein